MKKAKKAAPAPAEKKKEQAKVQPEEKKKAKKTETVAPKLTAKAKRAEENAARKQEKKEFREMEQDGGDWNVVVSKKKNKTEDGPTTPAPEKPNKKKDSAKEIKDRVNNELKNEETIKAAISEIKGKVLLFS